MGLLPEAILEIPPLYPSAIYLLLVQESTFNAGDLGSIPGLGRSPGEGKGNPLQYCCLENSMDGGAWWATVHRVANSRTRLSDLTFYFKSYQRDIRITVTNTARKHYRHLKKSSKNNFQHGIV